MENPQWEQNMAYSAASGAAAWLADIRKQEYESLGVSTDKMIVAMWEMIVENRPEAMNALQAKRQAIKNKHPKE
jgi:hypothetical protein